MNWTYETQVLLLFKVNFPMGKAKRALAVLENKYWMQSHTERIRNQWECNQKQFTVVAFSVFWPGKASITEKTEN